MKASEFTVDGKVLVVKCNDSKCRGCNGLDWSDKTEVDIGDKWNPNPVCDDGGYYGWAWGIGVGSGKQVDVRGVWHVWEVFPGDIVSFDGKAKWKRGKRVFVGCYAEAMKFTMYGRQKLVAEKSKGSASASGDQGSASASGDHGSALASGDCGSASASGEMGIASVTCAENFSVVESGVGGICAVIGETFKWKVHIDSVLIQRWESGGKFQTAVLYPKKLKLKTGTTVVVNKGKIAK